MFFNEDDFESDNTTNRKFVMIALSIAVIVIVPSVSGILYFLGKPGNKGEVVSTGDSSLTENGELGTGGNSSGGHGTDPDTDNNDPQPVSIPQAGPIFVIRDPDWRKAQRKSKRAESEPRPELVYFNTETKLKEPIDKSGYNPKKNGIIQVSPDGKIIGHSKVVDNGQKYSIRLVYNDGRESKILKNYNMIGSYFTFTPDSKAIIYIGMNGKKVYQFDLEDGSGTREIFDERKTFKDIRNPVLLDNGSLVYAAKKIAADKSVNGLDVCTKKIDASNDPPFCWNGIFLNDPFLIPFGQFVYGISRHDHVIVRIDTENRTETAYKRISLPVTYKIVAGTISNDGKNLYLLSKGDSENSLVKVNIEAVGTTTDEQIENDAIEKVLSLYDDTNFGLIPSQ